MTNTLQNKKGGMILIEKRHHVFLGKKFNKRLIIISVFLLLVCTGWWMIHPSSKAKNHLTAMQSCPPMVQISTFLGEKVISNYYEFEAFSASKETTRYCRGLNNIHVTYLVENPETQTMKWEIQDNYTMHIVKNWHYEGEKEKLIYRSHNCLVKIVTQIPVIFN